MQINEELKMFVVYSNSKRIVGKTANHFISTIRNGILVNGRYLGASKEKKIVHFLGKPLGKGVYVKCLKEECGENINEEKESLGTYLENYNMNIEDIIFFHDLKTIDKFEQEQHPSLEKDLVEKRAVLSEVLVFFNHLKGYIKGETYLNKEALDNGMLLLDTRFENWFILQNPDFSMPEAAEIIKYFKIDSFQNKNELTINALFINENRVSLATK